MVSNEAEYGSVEGPLSMHKTGSNETAFVPEISSTINDENVVIASGQRKIGSGQWVSILKEFQTINIYWFYLLQNHVDTSTKLNRINLLLTPLYVHKLLISFL